MPAVKYTQNDGREKQCQCTAAEDTGVLTIDSEVVVPRDVVHVEYAPRSCLVEVTAFSLKPSKVTKRDQRVAVKHRLVFDDEKQAQSCAEVCTAHAKRSAQKGFVHLIVNPVSGTGKATAVAARAVSLLTFFGTPFRKVETNAPRHATQLAAELAEDDTFAEESTVVCCVGGDGLLHELVNGFTKLQLQRPPLVALLPAGSGNGMGCTLGMDTDEDALFALVKGKAVPLDAFKFTQPDAVDAVTGAALPEGKLPVEKLGVLMSTYGVMADIDFDSEWLRFLGGLRFAVWAVWKLVWHTGYRAKVRMTVHENPNPTPWTPELASKGASAGPSRTPFTGAEMEGSAQKVVEFEEDLVSLIVGNAAIISKGLMTNPFARLADGLLDVMIMRRSRVSRFDLFNFFDRVETTALSEAPYVEFYKVSSITVTPITNTPREGKVDLDGEWMPHGAFTLSVLPASLRILQEQR